MEEGGLDGKRAGHFGHCDTFTRVDVKGGVIEKISTITKQGHVQGGCMVPVNLLAENQVNALIVGGIGTRPLMGFRQVATMICDKKAEVLLTGYCGPNAFKAPDAARIKVGGDVSGTVRQAVAAFADGKVKLVSEPNAEGHW